MVLQLREAISNDGRSLNQLAKATGVDSGRLSRFMRGERDLNLDAACRICEVLGIQFVMPPMPTGAPAEIPRRSRQLKAEPDAEKATEAAPPKRGRGKARGR
jgi:transcriptional regulator with XRE-family HTH domain